MPHDARLLQMLLDNATDFAVILMDASARVVIWNRGAEALLGWNESEVLDRRADFFFTNEDIARGAPDLEMAAAREHGRAADERWHVRKNGSRFWGSGVVQPVWADSGALYGYTKIFRDLTAQREAQAAEQAEHHRLEATLDAGDVGTWLLDIATGVVTTDARMRALFGIADEHAGEATVEDYIDHIDAEDAPAVRHALTHAMETGERFATTFRLRSAEGVVTWLDSRGRAAFNAEGRFSRLYGAVIDVTERREMQEALRLSEEKYRLLLTTVDQGFCHCEIVADASGRPVDYRFLEVNPAFETMTGLHEPIGKTVRELIPNLEDWWIETYGRVALTGMPARFQQRSDVLGRVYDVYAAAVGPNQFVILFTDITARTATEQQLDEHMREIEGLNARLQRAIQETHHRIKNNLQVVVALAEMQAEHLGDGAALDRIKQHVHTLASIHDLLTQHAKANITTNCVSTQAVIDRLIAMLQLTNTGRQINGKIVDVLIPVQKAASLSLLISECVSNAIKHGRGSIDVELVVEQARARLEVCDGGPGFPPGFDPRTAANTGLELIESAARLDLRGDVRFENGGRGGRVVATFYLDPGPCGNASQAA